MKTKTIKSEKAAKVAKVKTVKVETVKTEVIETPAVEEIKTNKDELELLMLQKSAADKAFFEYRALYNRQHNVKGRDMIKDIIAMHKKGKTNKEIVEAGYNKNTVNRQVTLFKKGTKVEKTIVRKYFAK